MDTFPDRALASLNAVLVTLVDTLMAPLVGLPVLVGLTLVSLPTALVIVGVIRQTTNQPLVRRTKRHLYAALLEIRLFNDDPRAVLQSVRDALRHNFIYLRLSLLPLAILSLPLLLLFSHLNAFYGYTGLMPGATALLKVEPRATRASPRDLVLSLQVPEGMGMETGPVRLASEHEVLWRIVPYRPGDFVVRILVGQGNDRRPIEKTLLVSDVPGRRSPMRVLPGIGQLRHPSEPPLDADGPISRITVTYGDGTVEVAGARVHWTIVFVALTLGWTLIVARVRGVAF